MSIIQGLWIGKELSLLEQLSIKSFLANGHPYHLYAYDDIRNIPNGTVICDANQILHESKIFTHEFPIKARGSYGAFSDIFRMKLLNLRGGYWCDADLVCLRPLDFTDEYVFGSYKDRNGLAKALSYISPVKISLDFCLSAVPTPTIMKVPLGCDFIAECDTEAESIKDAHLVYAKCGPILVRRMIEKHNLQQYIMPSHTFCPIDSWNFHDLFDPNYKFVIPEGCYAIHFWNELLRRRRRPWLRAKDFLLKKPSVNKDRRYPDNTIYGYLQSLYL